MKILFSPKTFEKLRGVIEPLMPGHDIEVADPSEVGEKVAGAEVLVTGPMDVDEDLVKKAPSLKLVHQWGVGVERIDIEACSRRGIAVCNVPSGGTGNAEGVAEITLMHMLMLSRKYFRTRESLRKGRLYSPQGISLFGKKACVVGLGNVGQNIATRLKCMGMSVRGVNRTKRDQFIPLGLDSFFPLDRLLEAVRGCMFVILSLELNDDTRDMADDHFFDAMDRNTYLVNVGRAELVSRPAFERALASGILAGAGFDVFWDEPADPGDPLLENQLVTITPHVGGVTDEAVRGVARIIAENISRLEKGIDLINRIDNRGLVRQAGHEQGSHVS